MITALGTPARLAAGLGTLLALLLALSCSPETPPQRRVGAGGGPVPVTAATAVRRDVPLMIRAIGAVEASNTVKVRARAGGELLRVGFTEGQDVRQGDLLFAVDARSYEAALQSAQADSARDAARYASALAQEQRYAGLIDNDYVTKQDFDEVKATAAALRATLQADAAAVRSSRLNLSYCTIRAPISGRTGAVLARQGSLVGPNDANPLVTIQQLVPIQVSFSVPEQHLPEIRRYAADGTLRVQAIVHDHDATIHEGSLAFVDNTVDRNTGTILLKATFPNQDQALWPGQFVDVALILTTLKDAVVVPSEAVQQGQRGSYVYLIKPDLTAAMQPVTPGPAYEEMVVVSEGLQPEDRVVTDGQLRLTPGAKVEIKPPVAAAAGPTPAASSGTAAGGAGGK